MTSNFIAKFAQVNYLDVLLAFAFSLLIGGFIYFVYRKTFSGVMYSNSFGLSLVAMTMITNVAILAVTQNVVLSLGMVGALSIVRFRAAVKEPMEIAFMFWAISEGIVIGAGLLPVALIGAVFIGAVLFLVHMLPAGATAPYMLVFHASDAEAERRAMEVVAASVKRQSVKSKTVTAAGVEVTVEVRLQGNETDFVNSLGAAAGVSDITLVSYNGDYMA